MIRSGTGPTERDARDYSYSLTFGTTAPERLPDEFNVDIGLTMPDQNADLNGDECTGYTTCDLGTDQDGVEYCPEYTYMKTLEMQGLPPETRGSDIRPALKSASVYGLLPKENMPEILRGKGQAFTSDQAVWPVSLDAIAGKLEHRKGKYFNVYTDSGLDWYDTFKSTIWGNRTDKRGISIGTPWFPLGCPMGIMPDPTDTQIAQVRANPRSYSWHNYAIKGWTKYNTEGKLIRDGEIFLKAKAWTGREYGDKGWIYISERCINRLMEIPGSAAFTLKDATEADIQTIKLGMIAQVLLYMARLFRFRVLA